MGSEMCIRDSLKAENHFLDVNMSDTDELQSKLFDEYVSRIKQDDTSVPYLENGYIYSSKYQKGEDYRRYYRKKNKEGSKEELFLDLQKLAKEQKYFSLGGWSISTNNKILAYSSDLVSRREYTIHFKDLITGEIFEDKIENTTGGITWANDNKTVFYVKKDSQTLRSHKIFKHVLGTDSSNDELIYFEEDDTFYTGVYRSKSGKFIIIYHQSTLVSDYQILNANNPDGSFKKPIRLALETDSGNIVSN